MKEYDWDELKNCLPNVYYGYVDLKLSEVVLTLMKRIEELEKSITILSDEIQEYNP